VSQRAIIHDEGLSPVEDEFSDQDNDSKSTMVKRSHRLNSFFGENVAPHLINGAAVDPETKKVHDIDGIRKKWDKLQNILGTSIPFKAIMLQRRNKTLDEIDDQGNSDTLFSLYQDVIQTMSTAIEDAAQLIEILFTFSDLNLSAEKSAPEASRRRISIELNADSSFKKGPSNAEKKIVKLENIFGSDVGVTALLRQIESQILSDLESLIESDISHPEHQKILRSDMEKTRNKIHSKVTALSEHCRIVE
jgi:hypothetical protein